MSQTRWRVRCALAVAATCAPLALLEFGGPSMFADAKAAAVLTSDGDVTGPATAVQQAVRVAPPANPGASTTTPAGTSLVFPMQATPFCMMLDNYGDARSGGRIHEGTDILGYYQWTADQIPNQEVYAVVDGTLGWQKIDGQADATLSGNSWRLYSVGSKTYYMYAHLSRFADGLVNGSVVKQGQVIGYVGDTGDPGEGNFHLHFEVHPTGDYRVTVDPMPLLRPVIPAGCSGG
jgi:murein DD-endopeptidase MepM/ murein hydrolase activator NlpD